MDHQYGHLKNTAQAQTLKVELKKRGNDQGTWRG